MMLIDVRRGGLLGLLAGLWLLALAPLAVAEQTPPPPFDLAVTTVEITTAAGEKHVFLSEIADRMETRSRGLMYRERLDARRAMLFVYDHPQEAAFWMKNTLIPLDIVFITPEGRILRIHEMATPGDLTPLPSGGKILTVLEIQGGLAAKLGLAPGDQVAWTAPAPR